MKTMNTTDSQENVVSAVSSLTDFMSWVEAMEGLLEKMNNSLRSPGVPKFELYFRGVDCNNYPSDDPSIFRNFGWIRNEDVFVNECLSKNPRDFSEDEMTFDILVRMQHYGVPTRLLDITKNPLVALYFATKGCNNKIGKVVAYFVSGKKIYYPNSPLVALYSNLACQNYEQWRLTSIRDDGKRDLIRRASSDVVASDEFYSGQSLDGVCCVKPKMTNERIIRQDGAFLLFGMSFNKEFCPKIFSIWDYKKVDSLSAILVLLKNPHLTAESEKMKEFEDFLEEEIKTNYSEFYREYEWKLSEEIARQETEKKGEVWTRGLSLCIKYFFCLDKKETMLRNELEFHFERIKYAGCDFIEPEEVAGSRRKFDEKFLEYSKMQAFKQYLNGNGYIAKTEIGISGKGKIRKEIERLGIMEDELFPELEVRASILKERFKEEVPTI